MIKTIFDSAMNLVKLPTVKILIVVLLISNGIQFGINRSNNSDYKAEKVRMQNKIDTCESYSRIDHANLSAKLDSVKTATANQYIQMLQEKNQELNTAMKEVQENNRIMERTIQNLRKR